MPLRSRRRRYRQPALRSGRPAPSPRAVLITCLTAATTALGTLLMTGGLLLLGYPLLDFFTVSDRVDILATLLGAASGAVALSALAVMAALKLLHGRPWARWVLAALCVVAALASAVLVSSVLPLVVTAAALAVLVLLLLPSTGAWCQTGHTAARPPPVAETQS